MGALEIVKLIVELVGALGALQGLYGVASNIKKLE
jgi:hypothetical protein